MASTRPLCDTGRPLPPPAFCMGTTARKKRSAGAVPSGASGSRDASAPRTPSAAGPAEPLERARLLAEVARQRVRIAKEELKRARKRVKEAKREAKRARKQADATRKAWKKARKAHRAKGSPEASTTGTAARPRRRKARAQKAKGPTPRRTTKSPTPRRTTKRPTPRRTARGPTLRRTKRPQSARRRQLISPTPPPPPAPDSQADGSAPITPSSEA